jgi:hypothetical protein
VRSADGSASRAARTASSVVRGDSSAGWQCALGAGPGWLLTTGCRSERSTHETSCDRLAIGRRPWPCISITAFRHRRSTRSSHRFGCSAMARDPTPSSAFFRQVLRKLIVNLKEDRTRLYDPEQPNRYASTAGTILAGVQSRYQIIDTSEQEYVAGVAFRPGGNGGISGNARTRNARRRHAVGGAVGAATDRRAARHLLSSRQISGEPTL